jgi:hypothetical protein
MTILITAGDINNPPELAAVATRQRVSCIVHTAALIGTGVLHSYADVVAEVKRAIPSARVQIAPPDAPPPSYLVRSQAFDLSKAKALLGYSPNSHSARDWTTTSPSFGDTGAPTRLWINRPDQVTAP